jgi:hypothetical protein
MTNDETRISTPRYHPIMQRTLAFLLLLLLTTLAAAQTRPADDTVLRELADPNYDTRQRATQALLANDALTPEDIRRLYAASTLAEQRHRLLDAAHHHFLRRVIEQQFPVNAADGRNAVGSLGVLLADAAPSETVDVPEIGQAASIRSTYPGFPAYASLRPGDLVVAVNDTPLPTRDNPEAARNRFTALIKQHKPGESVRLTLYREGKRMEVTSKLAPFEALTSLYVQSELMLMPNIQQRWLMERRQITAAHPPAPPLTPDLTKSGPVSAPEPPRPHVNRNEEEPDAVDVFVD